MKKIERSSLNGAAPTRKKMEGCRWQGDGRRLLMGTVVLRCGVGTRQDRRWWDIDESRSHASLHYQWSSCY